MFFFFFLTSCHGEKYKRGTSLDVFIRRFRQWDAPREPAVLFNREYNTFVEPFFSSFLRVGTLHKNHGENFRLLFLNYVHGWKASNRRRIFCPEHGERVHVIIIIRTKLIKILLRMCLKRFVNGLSTIKQNIIYRYKYEPDRLFRSTFPIWQMLSEYRHRSASTQVFRRL